MPEKDNAVTVATTSAKLRDGVLDLTSVESANVEGCTVFTHYNGPTDQLDGICAGMAVLETYEHAKARGATILAELAGVGMSADASDIVAPTVEGPTSAMTSAPHRSGCWA